MTYNPLLHPTFALCLTCLPASVAFADAPRVVTDIAPVHSLVAQVMEGVGTPELLIEASASPHSYSLRPSQATALGRADAVFWIGHELTPWMEKSIDTLATNAQVVSLLDAPKTMALEVRETEQGGHDHEEHDDHENHDDHADHKDHDDHEDHAEHKDHDAHEAKGHDDHGHAHEGVDPHAWLDPLNGVVWLDAIATELSKIDPENADKYRENADKRAAALQSQVAEIKAAFEPVRDYGFIVFHDAFQYFDTRFDLTFAGSISIGDASKPSASRLQLLRQRIDNTYVGCIFSEPQYNDGLVKTVIEGTSVKAATLDPHGVNFEPGPELYGNVIKDVAGSITTCLTP